MQRNTRQREIIREVFASAGRPLSPQEVMECAQETISSLGIATVYRALREFVEEGWLIGVGVAGKTRYELAEMEHHHHFHCQDCDKIYDIAGCVGDLRKLIPTGFVAVSHELTITGTCRPCARSGRRRVAP